MLSSAGETVVGPRSCASAGRPTAISNTSRLADRLCFFLGLDLVSSMRLRRQLQICVLVAREGHRVSTGVARRAIGRTPTVDRRHQPLETEVAERVGANVFADLVEAVRRR